MNRGLSLLEVLIAGAIMAVVFAVAYALVFSAARLSEAELALRDRQFKLHALEDALAAELRESSPMLIRATAFSDAAMPSSGQTVLTIVSARDALNVFQVRNAAVVWQKVIVYAPYWDSVLNTGEIRRYELTPAPGAFTDATQTPAITVTATTLTLAGTPIPRSSGQRVLLGVNRFVATNSSNSVTLDVALQGSAIANSSTIDLQTGAAGRNGP